MPYASRKVRGKSCYRVYNKENNRSFAKCTTQQNAIRQMRLLRAIQYNKSFVPLSNVKAGATQKQKKYKRCASGKRRHRVTHRCRKTKK